MTEILVFNSGHLNIEVAGKLIILELIHEHDSYAAGFQNWRFSSEAGLVNETVSVPVFPARITGILSLRNTDVLMVADSSQWEDFLKKAASLS